MDQFDGSIIRGLILDMDGVLWHGPEPIGNLPAIFSKLDDLGIKVILATNNSTASITMFQEKLAELGVIVDRSQIINSAIVTAQYLASRHPDGGQVYVIGENGLLETLTEYGFESSEAGNHLAVIASLDRDVTYHKLSIATRLIRRGIQFIGTNPDTTYPTPDGLTPGAGSIIAAIEAATSVQALLMGKPEPEIFRTCLKRLELEPNEVLVVGDRLETDIAGGQRQNMSVALVLSGISTHQQAAAWQPPIQWIGPDLENLVFGTLAK